MPLNSHGNIVVANTLRSCQLFSGIPETDLDTISSFVIRKQLEKGEYLFQEGAKSEGFYVMQTGAINVHRVNMAGKEQTICVFHAGESFAEASLATATGYPAAARAIEPSTVLLVPKKDFIELLRNHPELALRMLGSMSQHLRVLVGLVDDLTLKDVETRLSNWLLKRYQSRSRTRRFHFSWTERNESLRPRWELPAKRSHAPLRSCAIKGSFG